MRVLYFARLRQIMGRGEDQIDVPVGAKTVMDLVTHLKRRDEQSASAFADLRLLRVAVNQKHAGFDASLDGVREVAFFPPVTGG